MTRRHWIAVAVGVLAMLVALAPPLWIRATGDEVALALEPVDPLSLFRGNYVDLEYDVDLDAEAAALVGRLEWGAPVYVVFDDARPARILRVTPDRPELAEGQTCVRGRAQGRTGVEFPELEQFFVTPDEGRELERDLGNMVGIVKTTGSCRAVLMALEPR